MKKSINDLGDIQGKRALIRVDVNVPLDADKNVTDDTRIQAILPTVNCLKEQGAKIDSIGAGDNIAASKERVGGVYKLVALEKEGAKALEDFYFLQVKEKYNELRCYHTGSKEIEEIIDKYSTTICCESYRSRTKFSRLYKIL